MAGRRRRRLRFRVLAAFALGGLAVPASLSALSYALARTYLLSQRQSSAIHQARANAQLVRALLRSPQPDVARLVASLETPSTSQSVVLHAGKWFGTSAVAGPDALPAALRSLVTAAATPASQRYELAGHQVLAVGVPLTAGDAYFEVFPLSELSSTLRTLRNSLAAGSVVGFLVSLLIGGWATRRVLRPVRDIGRTAASIASGRLDARLDAGGDRELAELASSFNAMVDGLRRRVERDARFASDVSHELRSPLTTLHSAVEVMQRRRDQLGGRAARALDLLTDEVYRFEQLVEDLLEISRYDAGVAQLDLTHVEVVGLLRALLAESEQEVTVRSDRHTVVIAADRRRLEQALRNLVRNAVVHAGGVSGATVAAGPDWVDIAVEDGGPGVPLEDREAIFERFARGRLAGQRSSGAGVGLGLALVAEHVSLQGGQVHVESRGGGGSRFVIRLPMRHP